MKLKESLGNLNEDLQISGRGVLAKTQQLLQMRDIREKVVGAIRVLNNCQSVLQLFTRATQVSVLVRQRTYISRK